jgi:outer membrane protein assembly factor BamE (lipoprotein component of BamABCDE complex)
MRNNASRRVLLLSLVAGIAFFYPLLAPPPHRIDPAHFELIKNGMTAVDVAAILGAPPGHYDGAEPDYEQLHFYRFKRAIRQMRYQAASIRLWGFDGDFDRVTSAQWVSRHGVFTIYFDSDGTVRSKQSGEARVVPPWERLRRFLDKE